MEKTFQSHTRSEILRGQVQRFNPSDQLALHHHLCGDACMVRARHHGVFAAHAVQRIMMSCSVVLAHGHVLFAVTFGGGIIMVYGAVFSGCAVTLGCSVQQWRAFGSMMVCLKAFYLFPNKRHPGKWRSECRSRSSKTCQPATRAVPCAGSRLRGMTNYEDNLDVLCLPGKLSSSLNALNHRRQVVGQPVLEHGMAFHGPDLR